MPAPIGPFVGFSLGVLFAWAAADDLGRAQASLLGRSLLVVALFGLLVFAPAAGFFVSLAPDWSYAYLLAERPPALDLGLVLLDAAAVPIGFAIAARYAAARNTLALVRIAAAPVLIPLTFVVLTLHRLSVHATYAQYHGDFGVERLSGSYLGYGILYMLSILLGAVVFTVHTLRKAGAEASEPRSVRGKA
jgi:hypothetical protein